MWLGPWLLVGWVARCCHLEMAPVPASPTLPPLLAAASPGRAGGRVEEGASVE